MKKYPETISLRDLFHQLEDNLQKMEAKQEFKDMLEKAEVKDKADFEKYAAALEEFAKVGLAGQSSIMEEKKKAYVKGKKIIEDTFGKKEYPADLDKAGPLVKMLIAEVWLPHKEGFMSAKFSMLEKVVASACSALHIGGFEGISKRKEKCEEQVAEMKKILGMKNEAKAEAKVEAGNKQEMSHEEMAQEEQQQTPTMSPSK